MRVGVQRWRFSFAVEGPDEEEDAGSSVDGRADLRRRLELDTTK